MTTRRLGVRTAWATGVTTVLMSAGAASGQLFAETRSVQQPGGDGMASADTEAGPTYSPPAPAATPRKTAPAPEPTGEAAEEPADDGASPFSIQVNFDYFTGYFFRGIVQEDSGLILQPAARLTVNLAQRGDVKFDVFAATWNSFHGQKTGSQTRGDFTEYWYESDVLGGATLTLGKVALTGQYVFLTSPNDAFETVQEFNAIIALDDSEWLGALSLKPYALFAVETGADALDGADSDTGVYLELGVAPGFAIPVGKKDIAISFPVMVGLSLDNYYQNAQGEDETFGFVQVGARASVPLPIVEKYGAWTLNAGVAGLFLGDHTKEYNSGDDAEVIGNVGLQVNF